MLTNKRFVAVEFGHCDPSGIVYNPNYFIWFDCSIHALLASGGITLKALISEFGVDGIPVVEYKSKFLAPARWGDELLIESSVIDLHRCAFDVRHRVLRGRVLVADCTETRVCTAVRGQEGVARSRELPDKLVQALLRS